MFVLRVSFYYSARYSLLAPDMVKGVGVVPAHSRGVDGANVVGNARLVGIQRINLGGTQDSVKVYTSSVLTYLNEETRLPARVFP